MIDKRKAVFLPVDNRILNLYKGYVLNGEMLQIANSDISTEKTNDKFKYLIDRFLNIFTKKKKSPHLKSIKSKKYSDTVQENIPEFLYHCKSNFANVYLYSYRELISEEKLKVEALITSGLISSCQTISKLSDLDSFIRNENISLQNSLLVISDSKEKKEADLLGFYSGNGFKRNVHLWRERKFRSEGGEGELEWNSNETIIELTREVEYYLRAENDSFLTNDLILFIEDKYDTFLNNYIQNNLSVINKRLKEKQMQLIYFPSFQNDKANIQKPILEFLRYKIPVLYSLNDVELNEAIQTIFQKNTTAEFYRIILEELQLPFFKRPCLLRNISGGSPETANKFTYKHIEYRTEKDLDELFSWYIDQVRIPDDFEHVNYSLVPPPAEYNADWYFGRESKKDTEELKQKIDKIKSEGKFGVLAEAIMYMLKTIKDEKPEILKNVKPLIEKKKLLESKVILSPILIDNHYKIFLPDFGNIEVKFHALPKTLYLLFLRYPNGIRFKELYQYKSELLDIYNKLTNQYDKDEITRAISDLVDMTKNSINEKCSRIKEAFLSIMDDNTAKHYYITGERGEPKRISLPQNLIDIRY